MFSFQLVLSSHQVFPQYVPSFVLSLWGRVSADDPRDIMGTLHYSPNVVFCRAEHTRAILECTRNQGPLTILIMPFSSSDKHEVIIFA